MHYMSTGLIGQTVEVRSTALRVSFDSGSELTLERATEIQNAAVAVLTAGLVGARAELMAQWQRDPWPVPEPYVPLRGVLQQSRLDAAATRVLRIRYSNPYELLLAVSGTALSATVVVSRCVKIFKEIQHARYTKAYVDKAVLILSDKERGLFETETPRELEESTKALIEVSEAIEPLADYESARVRTVHLPE